MLETRSELGALQRLLDESLAGSSDHLRSIVARDDHAHTFGAETLTRLLTGMRVITIATVTAKGEPRISALDGFFLHGTWVFGTAERSPKGRHLLARSAASVAYVEGEQLGVFAHGRAEVLYRQLEPEVAHPAWDETHAFLTEHYGSPPRTGAPMESSSGCDHIGW